MSHHLWRAYRENDVDKLRRLLAPAGYAGGATKSPSLKPTVGSAGTLGSSPRAGFKSRKSSGFTPGNAAKGGHSQYGRAEVNSRDLSGVTLLLRVASSTASNAIDFARALLDHPGIDIHAQDVENGWNALHRALYVGNIAIARLLLETERKLLTSGNLASSHVKAKFLIKTKDLEGNSPFDLYNATIRQRELKDTRDESSDDDDSSDSGSAAEAYGEDTNTHQVAPGADGDELFAFGSNKNLTLGLGDEDDRQYPERVYLQRPAHLVERFHEDFLQSHQNPAADADGVPTLLRYRRLAIRDVVLSKLHTAVLTTDPVSNLYVCGIGRGGRLGLGDENTRFVLTPVQGGLTEKSIISVALGLNHTMALTDNGEIWTWGLNTDSQLGYTLPDPIEKGKESMVVSPRQIFGPLKRERVIAIAASSIHSAAITSSSLYTWGKNIGQLALMDADSRSLEYQMAPRKVVSATDNSTIVAISAIDKATACLQANYLLCVYTSYGYNIVKFPDLYESIQLSSRQVSRRIVRTRDANDITQIATGGETIAAVSRQGDLYVLKLALRSDAQGATSTTNPTKIKAALTPPQCIWAASKDGVRSVDVSEHGSVIISTTSGAVWRRIKRSKPKDSYIGVSDNVRRKDFKFQRVPGISDIVAVRSSEFGAFAAIRKDSRVISENTRIGRQTLWTDIASLSCLKQFKTETTPNKEAAKHWDALEKDASWSKFAVEALKSTRLADELDAFLKRQPEEHDDYDVILATTTAPNVHISVHGWLLAARSTVLRDAMVSFRSNGAYTVSDLFKIETQVGRLTVTLQDADLLTLLNLITFIYEDKCVPAWAVARQAPKMASRYRQIRGEVMKLSTGLALPSLEAVARTQSIAPQKSMDSDLCKSLKAEIFFDDADVMLELDGGDMPAHSSLLTQRCPFFNGLFHGRSQGMWLAGREDTETQMIPVDLKHIDPESFEYVMRYLYTDCGPEMFDSIVTDTIDDFSDLVLDVMATANELMIDRLSQICQHVLAPFVTTRNIADLLNVVAPCSVESFKRAGFEYMCLQMETLLENHLLNDLDEDLFEELDDAVRENQAALAPAASTARIEAKQRELHSWLAEEIEEEHRIRVLEMAYQTRQRDDERRTSTSFKARFGSPGDYSAKSPTLEAADRRSRSGQATPFSPPIRATSPHGDLLFDMDDEHMALDESPLIRPKTRNAPSNIGRMKTGVSCPDWSRKRIDSQGLEVDGSIESSTPQHGAASSFASPSLLAVSPSPLPPNANAGSPWAVPKLATEKLDLRGLLTEPRGGSSALSSGLAAQKATPGSPRPTQPKMSQKERKRQQAAQASQAAANLALSATNPAEPKASPWQSVPSKGRAVEPVEEPAPPPRSPVTDQHLKAASAASLPRRTASPDTRFAGQSRSKPVARGSSSAAAQASPASAAAAAPAKPAPPLVPHSKTYIKPKPKAEAILGLNMSDIIGLQQREHQDLKDAVAKRSLQEIQQEQEFQEWWDSESKRTQEEEEARRAARQRGGADDKGRGRGRRGHRGKARVAEAGVSGETAVNENVPSRPTAEQKRSQRGRGRGGKLE